MAWPAKSALQGLFDLIELPSIGPVSLAVAIPSSRLRALPGFPSAALPEAGRIASGRGLSIDDCLRGCLGEAAELASSCDWGDRHIVLATEEEIGTAALSPGVMNGFSQGQQNIRHQWNQAHGSFDWQPEPYNPHSPLDWIAVEDAYGGLGRFAPADFVMVGRRQPGDETAVAIGDSSGCAAGTNAEEAKTAAVLELIERDAIGRWWYGRRHRQTLDINAIMGADNLTQWLGTRYRQTWLFDITTDIAVPVFAAVSAEPDGKDVVLGFSARLDGNMAAIAALTEMLQMEFSLVSVRASGQQPPAWAKWRLAVMMTTPPLQAALTIRQARPAWLTPLRGLTDMLEACARKAIDLWFVDMTHPAIGTPVWRALSTTLCHYKPRFGRARLMQRDTADLSCDLTGLEYQPLLQI